MRTHELLLFVQPTHGPTGRNELTPSLLSNILAQGALMKGESTQIKFPFPPRKKKKIKRLLTSVDLGSVLLSR